MKEEEPKWSADHTFVTHEELIKLIGWILVGVVIVTVLVTLIK